jgi:hypothetical protein
MCEALSSNPSKKKINKNRTEKKLHSQARSDFFHLARSLLALSQVGGGGGWVVWEEGIQLEPKVRTPQMLGHVGSSSSLHPPAEQVSSARCTEQKLSFTKGSSSGTPGPAGDPYLAILCTRYQQPGQNGGAVFCITFVPTCQAGQGTATEGEDAH